LESSATGYPGAVRTSVSTWTAVAEWLTREKKERVRAVVESVATAAQMALEPVATRDARSAVEELAAREAIPQNVARRPINMLDLPQREAGPFGRVDFKLPVTEAEKKRLMKPLLKGLDQEVVVDELAGHLLRQSAYSGRGPKRQAWLNLVADRWLAQFDTAGLSQQELFALSSRAQLKMIRPTAAEDAVFAVATCSSVERATEQWQEGKDRRWFAGFRNWWTRNIGSGSARLDPGN